MIWIRNTRLIDPATKTDEICDLLIEDGKIAEISKEISAEKTEDVCIIDGTGMITAPGLIDVHVHFRDPGLTYKEDILTGAAAAKRGGFTSVVCMANTVPAADHEETIRYVAEKGKQTGIHIYQAGAVTSGMKGKERTNMPLLKSAGAPGFTDDGVPIMDEALVREAMEEAVRLDVPLSFHEENPAYIQQSGINSGSVSAGLGLGGADRMAEISLVERDLSLALKTGASINIQHISSAEAVDLVRRAKRADVSGKRRENIHAEATPHHFTLNESAVIQKGTLAKMNPPLRTEEDRLAVIDGLKDGTIDLIATDHAPHSTEEKSRAFTEAPSGIIGLETALSLAIMSLVRPGYLTIADVIKCMSWNPAKLYHFDAGCIQTGKPADVVIFDPDEKWVYEKSVSKSENSPFLGQEMTGKVKYTICGGIVVYQEDK